ncbi:MAG: phenylacetate--CoA ligase family protein [Clostridia bacterium]|nr:phenylacetate--CoA ligase family protein [Clostridia bacterium]
MSIKTYSVEEIIAYARKHSKYYQELYKGIPEDAPLTDLPLINQNDFWANCDKNGYCVATRPQTDGQIFKSGGTTGDPKYSLYTAEEWQTMCECCGALLARGGLKNGSKVANMFYAGGLYASFLYTYSMLCYCPAKTIVYNLSGNISIEEMAHTILDHQIDCIAGGPSILTKLISYIREQGMSGFAVDTVYFAGETLYHDQRKKICETFGRDIEFRSVFYASNDGGPLGYFTKDCGFNEHRTMDDLTYLELIDPDTGEVITEMNKPGVVYITSLFKTLIPLIRYPAGDMAEYTEPAGIPDRKFRILGRSDVAARAGYVTLYPSDIGNVLKQCGIDYYSYQIIADRDNNDSKDFFIFRIAVPDGTKCDTEKFLERLYVERPLIKDALRDGTLHLPQIEWCKPDDLEYNTRTGKLKVIIDRRK